MKKLFTTWLVALLFVGATFAQIERIGEVAIDDDELGVIKLSDGSVKFIYSKGLDFTILNSDFTVNHEFSFDTVGLGASGEDFSFSVLSKGTTDKLVDDDSKVETFLSVYYYDPEEKGRDAFVILDDDGSRLLTRHDAYYINEDLILSDGDNSYLVTDSAEVKNIVYKLPGTLPGNTSTSSDLSLSLSDDVLSLSNGSEVSLEAYKNTDEQQISLSNDTLYLTNGGWVYIGTGNTTETEASIVAKATASTLYPNPAVTSATLNYNLDGEFDGTLKIYNTKGQVVEEVELGGNSGSVGIDLSGLATGAYFYNIQTESGNSPTKKLIVQ